MRVRFRSRLVALDTKGSNGAHGGSRERIVTVGRFASLGAISCTWPTPALLLTTVAKANRVLLHVRRVGSLRRTGSLRTAVSVAGKRIFEGRDKELERASQVQERRCKSRHAVTLRGGLFKLHHGGLDVLTPRTFEVPQNVSRLLCFNAR
jgi:hypothetical protein